MKTTAHKKRLKAAIAQQVRHLTRCLKLVACVDLEIYALGRNIFSHDAALAQWLTEPAPSLRGAIPLVKLRTVKGRAAVLEALKRIAHGVPV